MEEALAEVERFAGSSSEGTRKKLVNSLRNTLYSIESQDETLDRIMFSVSGKKHSEQLFHRHCIREATR